MQSRQRALVQSGAIVFLVSVIGLASGVSQAAHSAPPAAVASGSPQLPPAGATITPAECSNTYLGLVPLPDLGTGTYKGYQGGLFPNGSNTRPSAHQAAGLAAAAQVLARNASGVPDPAGKIGLISVGMSNTSLEFDSGDFATPFKPRADADPQKNPQLILVNGAQGGQTADIWADVNDAVWTEAAGRVTDAGLTANQVQVAWVKQAEPNPGDLGAFPAHVQVLQNDLKKIAQNLKHYYPNLKLVYFSSRTRAYILDDGSPTRFQLNPEPMAYESGFAVKWLIEAYISNPASLGDVPYLTWGPYLWIDGLGSDGAVGGVPGRADGYEWTCIQDDNVASDVRTDDYTHPGGGGITKVGDMLLAFFKTDTTTRSWFLAPAGPTPVPPRRKMFIPLVSIGPGS